MTEPQSSGIRHKPGVGGVVIMMECFLEKASALCSERLLEVSSATWRGKGTVDIKTRHLMSYRNNYLNYRPLGLPPVFSPIYVLSCKIQDLIVHCTWSLCLSIVCSCLDDSWIFLVFHDVDILVNNDQEFCSMSLYWCFGVLLDWDTDLATIS